VVLVCAVALLDLLRDILQAIASQNAGNWQGVRAELVTILREEIPRE